MVHESSFTQFYEIPSTIPPQGFLSSIVLRPQRYVIDLRTASHRSGRGPLLLDSGTVSAGTEADLYGMDEHTSFFV
jgi:hypothetical protein